MKNNKNMPGSYSRFFAMIGTAIVAMFLLMYSNSYKIFGHAWFSETRSFMTLIMGGAMIIIMLAFMLNMYNDRRMNTGIFIGGFLILILGIWLVRSQVTVDDVDYMEGMIPHHSIAILTSKRAAIEDPRVRKLADEIIKAQRREIKEMEWLISDIRENGMVETEEEKEKRPLPEFKGSTEKETKETKDHSVPTKSTYKTGDVKFNPPKPEEAPEDIRQVVMQGYDIITNTKKHLPDNVGNQLNCHNCHFKGGITMGGKNGGISYVGVAAKYPKYRKRQDYSVDLMARVNNCLMRSLNGAPLAPESKEMTAIITYFHWISQGVPIYADIPWLGLKSLNTNHTPDRENGKKLYAEICARCHGLNGQGGMHHEQMNRNQKEAKMNHSESGPPLWGEHSFTDGAGMSKLETLASFAYYNMPRHNPILTKEQALDAAAYVTDQPRPNFKKDDKPW